MADQSMPVMNEDDDSQSPTIPHSEPASGMVSLKAAMGFKPNRSAFLQKCIDPDGEQEDDRFDDAQQGEQVSSVVDAAKEHQVINSASPEP